MSKKGTKTLIEAEEAAPAKVVVENDYTYARGFIAAMDIAIAFAEELAPSRNGGKRMREHFAAFLDAAKAQG